MWLDMCGSPWPTQILHVHLVILAPYSTQNCQLALEGKGFYWATRFTLVGHGWDSPQELLMVSETGQDWSGFFCLPLWAQAAPSPYWCPASFSMEISDLPALLQQELTLWIISLYPFLLQNDNGCSATSKHCLCCWYVQKAMREGQNCQYCLRPTVYLHVFGSGI